MGWLEAFCFLLLLHDEPWQPCHRLISRFLSPHSPPFIGGKLGIESVQVQHPKTDGAPLRFWALNVSQECSRNRMNVSSKLEAACFFSVLVTWVYIYIYFFYFRNHGEKQGWQIALFCFAFFFLAQTVSIYLFTILLTVEWHNGVSSHKLNEHKRKVHTHRV